MPTLFAIDFGQLGQVIWVSLLAGVAVSALFSVVILTAARASESRRAGRGGTAAAYVTLSALTFAAFAAGVVLGVQEMLSK